MGSRYRPLLSYASVVWIKSAETTKHIDALKKIQRRGMTMTLNAMISTLTLGIEVIIYIKKNQ